MYDPQGRYVAPSRAFSKHHNTGRWQTRTIVDFPSASRPTAPLSAEPRHPSKEAPRKYDIESLLAEVAELGALLSSSKPRTPGEIRQFPPQRQNTT